MTLWRHQCSFHLTYIILCSWFVLVYACSSMHGGNKGIYLNTAFWRRNYITVTSWHVTCEYHLLKSMATHSSTSRQICWHSSTGIVPRGIPPNASVLSTIVNVSSHGPPGTPTLFKIQKIQKFKIQKFKIQKFTIKKKFIAIKIYTYNNEDIEHVTTRDSEAQAYGSLKYKD